MDYNKLPTVDAELVPLHERAEGIIEGLPQPFQEDARRMGAMVTWLDTDPEAAIRDPTVRSMVDGLRRTGVVLEAKRQNKAALPHWLDSQYLIEHGVIQQVEPFDEAANEAASARLYSAAEELGYMQVAPRDYGKNVPSAPAPQTFKLYVSPKTLTEQPDAAEQVVRELSGRGFLKEFKVQDGQLVIYCGRSVRDFTEVDSLMRGLDIPYRGPAQEWYRLDVDPNGGVHIIDIESNDQALKMGARGVQLPMSETYDPASLVDTALQVYKEVGKSPTNPNLTSFLWCDVPEVLRDREEEMIHAAQEVAGAPVAVIWRKSQSPPPPPAGVRVNPRQ